jgi:hypothetical protein
MVRSADILGHVARLKAALRASGADVQIDPIPSLSTNDAFG